LKEQAQQKASLLRKSRKVLSSFLTFFLVISIVLLGFKRFTPIFDAYEVKAILTNSMADKMPAGTLVVTKKVTSDQLETGDVISFYRQGETVTHRIKKIITNKETRQFLTKGDANPTVDQSPVLETEIQGKVIYFLPKIGAWFLKIQQPRGLIAGMLALLALFLLNHLLEQIENLKNNQSEDEHYEEI